MPPKRVNTAVEPSQIPKRSTVIDGKQTSISLEDEFYEAAKHIAKADGMTFKALVNRLDRTRGDKNLSSAVRLYVLKHYQARLASK